MLWLACKVGSDWAGFCCKLVMAVELTDEEDIPESVRRERSGSEDKSEEEETLHWLQLGDVTESTMLELGETSKFDITGSIGDGMGELTLQPVEKEGEFLLVLVEDLFMSSTLALLDGDDEFEVEVF